MELYYPPVGFYFNVSFSGKMSGSDSQFMEVSGLDRSVNVKEVKEGGENRFAYRLPEPPKYKNLKLKRGIMVDSELIGWFKDAIEWFDFDTQQVIVKLLNEKGSPIIMWSFYDAYPVSWNVSDLKSMENAIAVESMEIAYSYFEKDVFE